VYICKKNVNKEKEQKFKKDTEEKSWRARNERSKKMKGVE
jgi:hypothetical protein